MHQREVRLLDHKRGIKSPGWCSEPTPHPLLLAAGEEMQSTQTRMSALQPWLQNWQHLKQTLILTPSVRTARMLT